MDRFMVMTMMFNVKLFRTLTKPKLLACAEHRRISYKTVKCAFLTEKI